ncbi:MAG: hypothetical protein EXR79_15310 [Myxococcales bacterium]|nr:hypothetical protein [Myxococcales bacterium]
MPIADAVQDAARNANLDDIRSLLERLRDLGRNHAVGFLVCAAIAIVPLSLLKSAVWAALMMPARAAAEVAVSSAEGAGRDAAVQSEKLRKLLERKLRKEDIDDAEIDLAKREYAESLRGTGDKAWVAIGAGAGSIMATLLALAATVIANLLLHGLAMPLAKTALTLQAGDLAVGGRGDWKQAWRRALTRLPVLIGAVIPGGVLIAFGTVLFVVPGLIAAFLFSFIAPVALLEGKTWLAALERSARLVLADWVRVAVVFVGLAVASALFRFVLGFGLSPLGFFGSLADDLILLVTVPVHAVAIVLLYVEAREAEDGFDEDGLREALDAGGTT